MKVTNQNIASPKAIALKQSDIFVPSFINLSSEIILLGIINILILLGIIILG